MTQNGIIINIFAAPVRAAANNPGLFVRLLVGLAGLALFAGFAAVAIPLLLAATAFLTALGTVMFWTAVTAAAGAVGVGLPLAARYGAITAVANLRTLQTWNAGMVASQHDALAAARREALAPPAPIVPVYVPADRVQELTR